MYFINPADYSLKEDSILIIYDKINKTVFKKMKINKSKVLKIDDPLIVENINTYNFVFKIRTNQGNISKEITKYFFLINKDDFRNFWLDKCISSQTQIRNYLTFFSNSQSNNRLRKAFNLLYKQIFNEPTC